ncbi:MAG: GHMP kinase [Nanoarchaeota archaeon]|nr:GHMP kinase [Nanoarchaeota archaeon]
MIIKKVRAPVRIDFAGGTTDISYFANKYGGAVLNAGINRYVVGKIVKSDKSVHLEYTGNTPTSSGLGTSGVMNLVWLALISQMKLKRKGEIQAKTKHELAEMVYRLEQAMGIVGGKQDQYAAAFGGINFIEFKGDNTNVIPLRLKARTIKELESRLVLVYTGKPHFAGSANKNMIDNIKKGKGVENLIRIRDIANEMKNTLLKGDLDRFSELMNEETENRIKLHKSVLPLRASKFIKIGLENGAMSAKICGSGNGGSILFYGDKKRLKKKFGKNVIDFRFDFEGLKWV